MRAGAPSWPGACRRFQHLRLCTWGLSKAQAAAGNPHAVLGSPPKLSCGPGAVNCGVKGFWTMEEGGPDSCSFCLQSLATGSSVLLPCGHVLHSTCALQLLLSENAAPGAAA